MKTFLKKYIPSWLKLVIRKYRYRPTQSPFVNKTARETFTAIYQTNFWHGKGSISGQGSDLQSTQVVIGAIDSLIQELNISSMLDIPCGDFHWMQHVNLTGLSYIGGDIVTELIEHNKKKYEQKPHILFEELNLLEDNLPMVDLLFVRDCFVHFSYRDFHQAMQHIINSKSTYLLTTSFPKHRLNYDIVTGDWRAINLQLKPYNFPPPLRIINEHKEHTTSDKSLVLWKITDLAHNITPS